MVNLELENPGEPERYSRSEILLRERAVKAQLKGRKGILDDKTIHAISKAVRIEVLTQRQKR